ncbi:MAG: DUF4236 domain-containing protein [Actinomycetota bacterium]
MGLYLRKSISTGPLRFNLSRGGIGMSAGVKGLRVGTGPRGAYVHAGRGGIYYRQTLGTRRESGDGKPAELPVLPPGAAEDLAFNLEQGVDDLVDSSGGDLVSRIADAMSRKKPSWFANPFTYKQRKAEWQVARSCPVFYELDDDVHAAYEGVVDAGLELGHAPGRWYDAGEVAVTGHAVNKGNAGAGTNVNRSALHIVAEALRVPAFNFDPLSFVASTRRLVFLPDQLLVQQGTSVVALGYAGLRFDVRATRFITSSVPPGVQPIGTTWQYVNAKGGPDRRYSVNPQLAVLATWELDIHHDESRFEFHTAFTDEKGVVRFAQSIADLSDVLQAT